MTKEQHALLLELAELQGRSAASYLREMLDSATPLLRSILPAFRLAAEQMDATKEETAKVLEEPLRKLQAMGMLDQLDLLDSLPASPEASGSSAASGSERGKTRSRKKNRDA